MISWDLGQIWSEMIKISLFNFPFSFSSLQPKIKTTLKRKRKFQLSRFSILPHFNFNFGASSERLFHPFLLNGSLFLVSTSTPVNASPLFSDFNFVLIIPLCFFSTALCFSFDFNSSECFSTPFRFQLCFHRTSPFLLHSSPLAVSYPSSLKSSE